MKPSRTRIGVLIPASRSRIPLQQERRQAFDAFICQCQRNRDGAMAVSWVTRRHRRHLERPLAGECAGANVARPGRWTRKWHESSWHYKRTAMANRQKTGRFESLSYQGLLLG